MLTGVVAAVVDSGTVVVVALVVVATVVVFGNVVVVVVIVIVVVVVVVVDVVVVVTAVQVGPSNPDLHSHVQFLLAILPTEVPPTPQSGHGTLLAQLVPLKPNLH